MSFILTQKDIIEDKYIYIISKRTCERSIKMIQDIEDHVFKNEYCPKHPTGEDTVFIFKNKKLLMKVEEEGVAFLTYEALAHQDKKFTYLFTIDDRAYYLLDDEDLEMEEEYSWESIQIIRTLKPQYLAFAAVTAYHLSNWYQSNRFCGRCALPTKQSEKERALCCEACGQIVYPRISPAIIVGIISEDRLLLTKYAGRESTRYGLVAGFCEIGETAEETVAREVMEEVELKVKNIRYYKSQPWGFSGDLLFGYFAEVDGSESIRLDENELSEATWVKREDLPIGSDGVSLTPEMMEYFRNQFEK